MRGGCAIQGRSASIRAATLIVLLLAMLVVFAHNPLSSFVVKAADRGTVPSDPTGCARCHRQEVDGYARTGMARSIRAAASEPAGAVHAGETTITMTSNGPRAIQQLLSAGEVQSFDINYVIGSGKHANGYITDVAGHLFQSPVAYYRSRSAYDLAPGYEGKPDPDFTRPITEGCVFCHAGANTYVPGSVNAYGTQPFPHLAISCDRCHGSSTEHLAKPGPGNIVNPMQLSSASRDSICEQCHLIGVARILNPGKHLTDYKPGKPLEDTLTIYRNASGAGSDSKIRVISHSEQLALSACARGSAGRLWCATCHDPHDEPAQPAAAYRAICLGCHSKIAQVASHPPRESDCIACHMPRRNTSDGGHTAFTDHRIQRHAESQSTASSDSSISAWREPAPELQKRNLGIALIEVGLERRSPRDLVSGYRTLTEVQQQFPDDSDLYNAMGNALYLGGKYDEALVAFARAVEHDPASSSKHTNLAQAYLALGQTQSAQEHLERALQIDFLNLSAVTDLLAVYDKTGDSARAKQLSQQVAQFFKPKRYVVNGHPPRK